MGKISIIDFRKNLLNEKNHKQIKNGQIDKIENGENIIDMNQLDEINKKSEELDEKVNPDKNSSMLDFIKI